MRMWLRTQSWVFDVINLEMSRAGTAQVIVRT
jgi:hypothetical protein